MHSPDLEAALAAIDTVFDGFASPTETGCGRCFPSGETEYLRAASRPVPLDVLNGFVFKAADHFDDHAAVMRRLLPQCARAMADGTLNRIGDGYHGLTRTDWRSWPAEQADAVEAFLDAWWRDALTQPEPPYRIEEIFDTCVTVSRSVKPWLGSWPRTPVADAHLVRCADDWLYHLISDATPFGWWLGEGEDAAAAELRDWLVRHGSARLRALGEADLATHAELLALPYEERWDRP